MITRKFRWEVWISRAFTLWAGANILCALWHAYQLSSATTHHWVELRTGASFVRIDSPNASPWIGYNFSTDLPRDSKDWMVTTRSWKLVEPGFSPELPWNWLSWLVVRPSYDPDETLRKFYFGSIQ